MVGKFKKAPKLPFQKLHYLMIQNELEWNIWIRLLYEGIRNLVRNEFIDFIFTWNYRPHGHSILVCCPCHHLDTQWLQSHMYGYVGRFWIPLESKRFTDSNGVWHVCIFLTCVYAYRVEIWPMGIQTSILTYLNAVTLGPNLHQFTFG